MTPDTPLLFFWIAAHLGAGAVRRDRRAVGWLLAAGRLLRAWRWPASTPPPCSASAPGCGCWRCPALRPAAAAARGRGWRRCWRLAVFLPVVAWNAAHGWASFLRQGGRAGRLAARTRAPLPGRTGRRTDRPRHAAGVRAVHRRALRSAALTWRTRAPGGARCWRLLAVPSALRVRRARAGRPGAGQLAGDRLSRRRDRRDGPDRAALARLRLPAVALGLAITLLVYALGAYGRRCRRRFDPLARQLAGWPTLAGDVEAARRQEGATFVAADQYGLAGELAWHLPRGVTVIGIEPRWAVFALPPARLPGKPASWCRASGAANRPTRPTGPRSCRSARSHACSMAARRSLTDCSGSPPVRAARRRR